MAKPLPQGAAADLAIVQALLAGRPGAWEAFVRRVEADVYTACRLAFAAAAADEAFVDLLARMRANGFALLRAFDGRAALSSFLRLILRDLLAQRLLELFRADANRGWSAFELFFRRDIERSLARYFRSGEGAGSADPERYQDICLLLIEDDYRRIRLYDGHGSFGGYVLRVVNNLCIDLLRREAGRRRLPAAIKRLPEHMQDVFRLLYWEKCRPEDLATLLRDAEGRALAADEIATALDTVRKLAPADRGETGIVVVSLHQGGEEDDAALDIEDESPDPEQALLIEAARTALARVTPALRAAIAALPAQSRLYLVLRFWREPPLPPREIARVMKRPEAEIYRLRAQTERLLQQKLREAPGVENWKASV